MTKETLAAMLNGTPTKETEYIKALGTADLGKGTQTLKENINRNSELPSAEDLNYSPLQIKQAGNNPPPPVSLDQITNLMAGKRTPNKPNQRVQQAPAQPKPMIHEDYYSVKDLPAINSNDDRFPSDEELHRQLMSKVPNTTKPAQMIREGVNSVKTKNTEISGGVSREEIKELIEEVVYEVLSEIIGEQNKNFDDKEKIKILVGETLFSGYIQKALPMPTKKK